MTFSKLVRRAMDYAISFPVVLVALPFGLIALLAVYAEDRHNPIYAPVRIGKDSKSFRMFKIRTMVPNADKSKVDSTSDSDNRVTKVGRFIRQTKLDEILQFVNVLVGTMSIVGPRPNIGREVALYTDEERRLLTVLPGISDLSSIVFSDLGTILDGAADANLAYNQLVRPWKSRLAMIYVDHGSVSLYFNIILLTALNGISRRTALNKIVNILKRMKVAPAIVEVASRKNPLVPHAPLGAEEIVQSRSNL